MDFRRCSLIEARTSRTQHVRMPRRIDQLENLTEEENAALWAEEAERRDQDWDRKPTVGRPACLRRRNLCGDPAR